MPTSLPLTSDVARRRSRLLGLVPAAALIAGLLGPTSAASAQDAGAATGPEVTIDKATNGVDADAAPGPEVEPGVAVTWTWTITASGTTTLYDLVVADSSGVSPDCDVTDDGQPDGTSIHPGPLDPGQSFQCSASGAADHSADAGPYAATGTVRASDFAATATLEASDPSHHTVSAPFVAAPSLSISTLVNGQAANGSTGPLVAEGATVTWTYIVTNTGNVAVSDIRVGDDIGAEVDCGNGTAVLSGPLAPGASASCIATAPAPTNDAGPQARTSSVVGSPIDPNSGAALASIRATDLSVYTPVQVPAQLAFTGPADLVLPFGLALVIAGLALLALARSAARREQLGQVPVRTRSASEAQSEPTSTD